MPDPGRDCPNCHQRIHPLDLSDLYRGRKINCAHCGNGLSVRVAWWVTVPLGLLVWWGLFRVGVAIEMPVWLESLMAGLLASLAALIIRYGLVIERAPWVRLSARETPWKSRRSWLVCGSRASGNSSGRQA
ncbi:MAG: hypothetical protein ACXIUM_02330 [Wenzhouxiangella sp.]